MKNNLCLEICIRERTDPAYMEQRNREKTCLETYPETCLETYPEIRTQVTDIKLYLRSVQSVMRTQWYSCKKFNLALIPTVFLSLSIIFIPKLLQVYCILSVS